MNCSDCVVARSGYLDGNILAGDVHRLEAHLESCAAFTRYRAVVHKRPVRRPALAVPTPGGREAFWEEP